ncbi:beta and beta-prime subunits of DNA dependent RNA-polymerase [Cylindrobasidium torrendii FP15055 ss-10]|uniref:DNA-directed RNA polymerase subunit n=1 Tax=Cylindrobasidium torrendii FP15055 ss-10 TaxID=1314674 RepID=A0A0D7BW16_9AGAR|nr:beta and beta-prime subunits of DNA dependent RNA-polymerase [Cylindrobasidium torrendii FP15055 ss-10]
MNISHSLPSTVTGISFTFLTTEDIRRISVKQIVNPNLLDDLNRPNVGGLYDPVLGPSGKQDICSTCRLTFFTCPGHYGHIELPAPVFHPLFMTNAYNLLRGVCLFCHHFKMSRTVLAKYTAKLRLLDHGLLRQSQEVDELASPTKDDNAMDVDGDNSDDEVTEDAFIKKLNLFVEKSLNAASSSKRDNYKDAIVYETRKEVIQDFLKSTILKKCQNSDCGQHAYTFRKDSHTKIVEFDLSAKQKQQVTKRRPDVLLQERMQQFTAAEDRGDGEDEEDDASEDEGAGDDIMSDQEIRVQDVPRAVSGKAKTSRGRNERLLAPEECRAHLRRLFRNEEEMCSLLFGSHGPHAKLDGHGRAKVSADIFFLEVLPVTPTRFRPPAVMNGVLFENSQNELLSKVLNTSYRLRDLNVDLKTTVSKKVDIDEKTRHRLMGQLLEALIQLQVDVNSVMDSSKNPAPVRQGKLPTPGIKQGLEKKEGLFRKHMMGKRVNYAARSVISPDANIETNEIGIPPIFAERLTFPEPVTPANINEMRERVINGPRCTPGASIVEYEDGRQVSLEKLTHEQREAIANQLLAPQEETFASVQRHGLYTRTPAVNKKVYRTLKDGDMLILNRQPTLHKPSMMVHKAKILKGEKTIRMHYANCNSYNADFDGDEMNIHFPQNQVARAEAMFIANTDNQYLVPTSGSPLRGLIQDHVVAGVWMTSRDTFFEREEYCQLLFGALRAEECTTGRLVTLPPAIRKPRALWTGKQIISTVLRNIQPAKLAGLNLQAGTKVPGDLWGSKSGEDKVLFMDGELLCGVLDKAAFGASDYGLIHSIYELYGPEHAGKLLGILSRLFTKFLQHRAFTCRMDDLILTPTGDSKRREILSNGRHFGTDASVENFPALDNVAKADIPAALNQLLEEVLRDDDKMAALDMTIKKKLSDLTASVSKECMPKHLYRQFPHNHMQAMTKSGAKGSDVNTRQISCGLGQQELEGRRVPVMVSGKTLPSFKPFETKAIAGGYVASRFLTGIKPQEFYFHCMAGREGLIDTAVKTSRSGYLQRCLIKHLEGISVHYDNTVRGADNSVYQFQYGGDALDVTKQKHLHQFSFIAANQATFRERLQPALMVEMLNFDEAHDRNKEILKKLRRARKGKPTLLPDPVLSEFNPSRYIGSVSETFAMALEDYLKANPDGYIQAKDDQSRKTHHPAIGKVMFKTLMNVKYLASMVDPGEAVGLLASQGVGEPSTQMTLNTFHFAGHGAANVTLGIPRLREIVMTASQKPKTPSMTMIVDRDVSEEDIGRFCKRASKTTLAQVVQKVTVTEELKATGDARRQQYTVDIDFYPQEEYAAEHDITAEDILEVFAGRFPLYLKKEIVAEMKKLDEDIKKQISDLGKGKKVSDIAGDDGRDDEAGDVEPAPQKDSGDGDESEHGDGDADDEKRKRQRNEQTTYEDDDEDDDEPLGEYSDNELEAKYDTDIEEESRKPAKAKTSRLQDAARRVESQFRGAMTQCTSMKFSPSRCSLVLEFNSDMPKLLFIGIIERSCAASVIRQIPGITDCFAVKAKTDDGRTVLNTNGSNFKGIWDFEADSTSILSVNETYSNDIYATLKTYGVEMARAAILREMSGVFGAYSIKVDMRHLELIADYMTFEGGYKPFNRKGLSTNPSPLLKASYETTASFLSDATLYGDFDDMSTPSGNIVLGRPIRSGTGAFDVVLPVESTV